MDLWRDRTKPKKGRPATGRGETRYIPADKLEVVDAVLAASPQLLDQIKKIQCSH